MSSPVPNPPGPGRAPHGGGPVGLARVELRVRARVADAVLFALVAGAAIALSYWIYFSAPGASYPWGGWVSPRRQVAIIAVQLSPLVLWAMVGVLGIHRRAQTIGMWTVGIWVVDRDSRQAPPAARSLLRWALPLLSVPACLIANAASPGSVGVWLGLLVFVCWWLLAYTSVLWDRHNRGWHDHIANTIVVIAKPPSPPRQQNDDTLWGGPGDDQLHGGGHNDKIIAGPGNDTLNGNNGNDKLWGGYGDDTIDAGDGTDYTDGGDDTDTCTRSETTARCET